MADVPGAAESIFTSKFFTDIGPGIGLACVGIAICGVGKAIANCADGICAACEIRVEMSTCIIPSSMIGAGLIFALIIAFSLGTLKYTDPAVVSRNIAAGLVGSLGVYYGCMAMGAVAKYGVGTKIRQKNFRSVFLIMLVVGELINVFGVILYFLIASK